MDMEDVEKLRREYRNMEVNRKNFAEESNALLRKQQQTLDKLRAENEELKIDVATLQARTSMKPLNIYEQSLLDSRMTEIEAYKNKICVEKDKISKLGKKIKALQEEIWNERRMNGGRNASSENQQRIEKQVRILENRLDQALVQFNKSLSNNRKLRQEIDDLRGERAAFDNVYKKLEKALQSRKRQMAQVIEHSNQAYEQRDKLRSEITAIEHIDKKEQEQFERQMHELEKMLEKDMMIAAERRKKVPAMSILEEEDSKAAAEKAAKAEAILKEKQEAARHRKEKIEHFEEAFRKITSATGISDVDDLVKIFLANDEQNFSMFTYANEQSNEAKKLEEHIQKIRDEQSKHEKENYGEDVSQFEHSLAKLQEKIESIDIQSEKFEAKTSQIQLALTGLQDSIKILLTRLDFHDDSTSDVQVNEGNMLHYLGIIEMRTNEILYSFKQQIVEKNAPPSAIDEITIQQHTTDGDNFQSEIFLGSGPAQPMTGVSFNVNPPRLNDYSSDEEASGDDGDGTSLTRPFGIDELKSKAKSRISKHRQSRSIATRRRSAIYL